MNLTWIGSRGLGGRWPGWNGKFSNQFSETHAGFISGPGSGKMESASRGGRFPLRMCESHSRPGMAPLYLDHLSFACPWLYGNCSVQGKGKERAVEEDGL